MYFSTITLSEKTPTEEIETLQNRDEYYYHQLVWSFFPQSNGCERDFIYRLVDKKKQPWFEIVSATPPLVDSQYWITQIREYNPQVKEGAHFSFSLRANPVVTKRRQGRPVRHDVVMNAKRDQKLEGKEVSMAHIIQEKGIDWLNERAQKYGFRITPDMLKVESYRQHYLRKKRARTIQFSTLDYDGVLTVTDREQFLNSLFRGVGPAKGFGCGLLTIHRV